MSNVLYDIFNHVLNRAYFKTYAYIFGTPVLKTYPALMY